MGIPGLRAGRPRRRPSTGIPSLDTGLRDGRGTVRRSRSGCVRSGQAAGIDRSPGGV